MPAKSAPPRKNKKSAAPPPEPTPREILPRKTLNLLIALALTLLTLAVFWQVRNHEFVNYDDNDYITDNYMVKRGLTWGGVWWAFSRSHANNWHPLTWLSHMLDWQLFGWNAGGHHLMQVALHLANTVLLFFLLQRMTGGVWRCAFVAALFAVHPLHVQSVAWASERKDTLSTLFWLLTMWTYWSYAHRPDFRRYALVLGLFALGLMAKPMLVTVPLVLLLTDYWPLYRIREGKKKDHRLPLSKLVWEKTPMFAITVISSVVTFLAQLKETVVSTEKLPLYERTANAITAYSHYIIQLFWPGKLAMLYPISLHIPLWKVIGSLTFLIVVTTLVLKYGPKHRYLTFGWFWYLITLVPVIGFVQVGSQAVADRYTYVPYIGLFVIIAYGVGELVEKLNIHRVFLWPAAAGALTACALYAYENVGYWKNSEILLRHTLEVTPDNCLVHNNYAITMDQKGNMQEAIKHYEEALRIKYDFPEVHNNLGAAYDKIGKHDEALPKYLKALELKPEYPDALFNTAASYRLRGKIDDAITYYKRALDLKPDYLGANFDLAGIYFSRNQFSDAIRHYEAALDVNPHSAEARNNLACALVAAGKPDEALAQLQRALQIKPKYPDAYKNLAVIYRKQGKFSDAIQSYRKGIDASDPNLRPPLVNDLAWLLATSPSAADRDPLEAVSLAEECNRATGGNNAVVLDTLAAAYASSGQFDKAVATLQQAIDICTPNGNNEQVNSMRSRLELYRAGKPFVAPES
jgi:tetratricopeptide (TPR) repeat protein